METALLQEKIAKVCAQYPQIVVGYLFGSHAQGRAGAKSDVDIAVLLDRTTTVQTRFATRLALAAALQQACGGLAVDVVVLNDVHSATLQYEVVREGKVLVEKDPAARFDMELRMYRAYEEMTPFFAAYNKAYSAAAV